MAWLPKGDAQCDSCPAIRPCVDDRHQSIEMMRAAGWRHMKGETLGGQPFETILCPKCAKDEKRRPRKNEQPQQDDLPFDFEELRIVVGRQGIQSR